jgi:hypothetical protein
MKAKPILEPKNVDLVLEGGDMTAADLKAFRALLRKSQVAIQRAQEKMSKQPWMDEPVPTLQQLVALQHKREDEADRKRPALPPGILDIDESGIGGSMTTEENAYMSAYIWSSKRATKNYRDIEHVLTIAQEPAPSWSAVKRKSKRTKP